MHLGAFLVTLGASLFFLCAGAVPSPAPAAEPSTIGGVVIGEIINLLKIGLVEKINAIITLDSLETNLISVNFDGAFPVIPTSPFPNAFPRKPVLTPALTAKNPLIIELTIDRVVSSAGLNGTVYATFDQKFTKPVVVPILGSKNSGTFGNVKLTKGVEASLDIIPYGVLDLIKTDIYVR
ncbi:hypothetical protein DXG03_001226 [Asterophora parasitica]|uniref:Uncharacterized protein n=1 Tax=Asterophora parasitica TaxID=117018 RepID=A0A9P7G3R5_9AGAR|nr:hypothetical protein DXG03_001226 [Asterophora parasitica]